MTVTVLKQVGTLFLNNDMLVFKKIIIVSLILTHPKHMIRDVIRSSRFTHFYSQQDPSHVICVYWQYPLLCKQRTNGS